MAAGAHLLVPPGAPHAGGGVRHGKAAWAPPAVIPGSAADARAALDVAIATWQRDLAGIDADRLWEPMGPEAEPYCGAPVASFVEYIHDEFIHHSAEVALLRDLYRARVA